MANNKKCSKYTNNDIIDAFNQHNSKVDAAKSLNIPISTFCDRLKKIMPNLSKQNIIQKIEDKNYKLEQQISMLKKELKDNIDIRVTSDEIRKQCFNLSSINYNIPDWVVNPKSQLKNIGTPSLALGDFHWEQVVDKNQVDGLNEFNSEIASKRFQNVIEQTIDLCFNHINNSGYPGIVVPILGDLFSGEIHLELLITNGMPTLKAFVDLYEHFIWGLSRLADKFGNVFVPCVPGNHSRTTVKSHYKDFAYMNYDWLMYTLLEKHFENDNRIKFLVTAGQDAKYNIYDHTYRMSHGAQFKGGDSIIGPLGPITRGDNKKRGWASQVDQQYKTSLYGHFHRLIILQHIIVNGSLVGRDEFCHNNNYPYEPPYQALWITNPNRGITITAPVHAAGIIKSQKDTSWVTWPKS